VEWLAVHSNWFEKESRFYQAAVMRHGRETTENISVRFYHRRQILKCKRLVTQIIHMPFDFSFDLQQATSKKINKNLCKIWF